MALYETCPECYGYFEESMCCGEEATQDFNGRYRCDSCGKFCKIQVCGMCEGTGKVEFKIKIVKGKEVKEYI